MQPVAITRSRRGPTLAEEATDAAHVAPYRPEIRMSLLPKLVFITTFLASALLYGLLCNILVAISEVKDLSATQYGVSLAYGLLLSLWLASEAAFLVFLKQPRYTSAASEDEEAASAEKVRAAGLDRVLCHASSR